MEPSTTEVVGDVLMTVTGENPALQEIRQSKNEATRPTLTDDDKEALAWIPWGDSDDYPQKLDREFRKVGVMQTAVDVNSNIHYGQGVEWVKKIIDGGHRTLEIQSIPEWDDFIERTNFPIHYGELIYSLEYLNIGWMEFVLKNSKRDIDSMQLLDTGSCRWAKRDSNGRIKNIFFNSEFGYSTPNKKDIEPIPLYDPKIPQAKLPSKFVFPVLYRTLGNNFYPEPNVQSVIANGWVENAKNVPKYIKSIYTNQIAVKYHINIPFMLLLEFVGVKEGDWLAMDLKTRLDHKVKCKEWIDTQLTSAENAGKSIVTFTVNDGGTEHKVEINPIESKLDSTKELPNSYAANYEIMFAANLDPELIGLGIPGGKNLSGSGSGKREALLLAQSLRKREREVSLSFPRVCGRLLREIGFPIGPFPTIVDLDISQTLDKNPTGKETKIN
jgi:hypothetical protein